MPGSDEEDFHDIIPPSEVNGESESTQPPEPVETEPLVDSPAPGSDEEDFHDIIPPSEVTGGSESTQPPEPVETEPLVDSLAPNNDLERVVAPPLYQEVQTDPPQDHAHGAPVTSGSVVATEGDFHDLERVAAPPLYQEMQTAAQDRAASSKDVYLEECSDDDDPHLAAAIINTARLQKSAYGRAMSDDLPIVSKELDFDEAEQRWKDAAVTDKKGEYIPFWSSTYADMEMLGTGIGLWFRTLKAMALYFALMSLPTMIMVGHYLYLYYNDKSDLDSDTIEVLARFTTGVATTTNQKETFGGWDVKDVMLALAAIDCFAICAFLVLISNLKRRQKEYIKENDEAVISLSDYSVMVWGIPRDATEDEVSAHFWQFGDVADCVVAKDIGKVMGMRMKRAKMLDKLVSMKYDAAYYEAHERGMMLAMQQKRISKQKASIIKCDNFIEAKLQKGFTSTCAFVTFEESTSRADVITAYRRGTFFFRSCQREDLKFRGEHILKVSDAPESSDLLWENIIRINPAMKYLRKIISWLCIFVLLMAAIGIVVYAKNSLSKKPPSVVCTSLIADPIKNPKPNLDCAAIWPLAVENANTNATSVARRSIEMFVANVDHDQCEKHITGSGRWSQSMGNFAPYDGAKVQNLPKSTEPWKGGFIETSQADECAALTCLQCYCVGLVSFDNVQDLLRGYDSSHMCAGVYDQFMLEAAVQFGAIAVTAATNMILMFSAGFFSRFERYRTVSSAEAKAAKYTFLALIVNQALVPVIIYSFIEILEGFPVLFQGAFTDFELGWYNKVMVMILGSAIVNTLMFPFARSGPALIGSLRRRLFTGCVAHSQGALNKLYKPPKFELAQRYGQIMCALFYTITFFAAAPILFMFAGVLFALMYAVDKFLLLKCSRKPPMYDHRLNALFLSYAPYACWIHLGFATWVFGHHTIPSYIIDPSDGVNANDISITNGANATDDTGEPDQFNVMSRLKRVNALLPFAFFLVLTISLFLKQLLWPIIEMVTAVCCERKEKVDEVTPFSKLSVPGDSRYNDPATDPNHKLSGLRSYRIEDNPDYSMLFPEAVSELNTKI